MTNSKKLAGLANIGAFSLCLSSHGATISNGGFEADTFTVFPGYISGNAPLTGWTASDDGRAGINPAPTSPFANNGVVPEGTKVAFLQVNGGTSTDLTSNSGITGLVPGQTYNVTYRVNSRNGGPRVPPSMGLILGGNEVVRNAVTAVGGTNGYKYVSHNFTATSATMSLSINNTTALGGDSALLLDDFSVTAVTPNFTASAWNNDATSGLSSSLVYTHAYNLGPGAANTSINGVNFTGVPGGNPGVPGSFSFNMGSATSDVANNIVGDSASIANTFVFGNQNATLSLEGLVDGETYRTSIFTVGWDDTPGRNSTLLANGERLTVDVSGLGNNNGTRVDFEFTANGTTQDIEFQSLSITTFHTYAFTNALIPEPSTGLLTSLAALAMLVRRKR